MRLFDIGGFQVSKQDCEIVSGELARLAEDDTQSDLRRAAFRKVSLYLLLFSKALS